MNMISVLDISLVKCYGTVKTKEESFLFQKPIASSIAKQIPIGLYFHSVQLKF